MTLPGPNDLMFADNGDLYFTDPGSSHLGDQIGRVLRVGQDGAVDVLMAETAVSERVGADAGADELLVALTHSLQVVRLGLHAPRRWRAFLQLSGGLSGPDGMAIDEHGNLAVVHAGFGTVWLFSPLGEPLARISSCAGIRTTNFAYGGSDLRTLVHHRSRAGVILTARMEVPGRRMYSHL